MNSSWDMLTLLSSNNPNHTAQFFQTAIGIVGIHPPTAGWNPGTPPASFPFFGGSAGVGGASV